MTSRGRGPVALAVAALMTGSLVACTSGADETGPRVLTWYVDDAGTYATMARTCTDESAGGFRIELEEAPADPAQRRADLLQRLRTGEGPDLIGLDTSLVPELASSDLLAPVPAATAEELTSGRTEESVTASTYDGTLVAAPWWYEPFVLFYRGSVAERAGLNVSSAVTWNELSAGAARVGGTVQIAGTMTDWVRALVAAGGAELAGSGRDPEIGLDGAAGTAAATAVRTYASSGVGPGPTPDAALDFARPGGAFLVAPVSALRSTELAPVAGELRIAPYPRTAAGTSAPAPLVGTSLAVAADTDDPDLAFAAVTCLTGATAQRALVSATGHVPTLLEVLQSPDTGAALDRLDIVTEALVGGAVEPRTPAAHLIALALESTWRPLAQVGDATPGRSAAEVARLLDGGPA